MAFRWNVIIYAKEVKSIVNIVRRIVSTEFYRARRPANNAWLIGYLVKNKEGVIEGILNKANNFHELAWIKPEALELYK